MEGRANKTRGRIKYELFDRNNYNINRYCVQTFDVQQRIKYRNVGCYMIFSSSETMLHRWPKCYFCYSGKLETFSVRNNRKTKHESDDCVKRCFDKIWELLTCNASILKIIKRIINILPVVNTKGKHPGVKCVLNT